MNTDRNENRVPADRLRRQALERLHPRGHQPEGRSRDDASALVYELEIHQVELEIQNEELRRSEHALREIKERYRELFELAPVGYLTLDPRGHVLEANLAAAALCAQPREDLLERRLEQLVHHDDRDTCYLFLRNVRAGENRHVGEVRLERPDQDPCWVRIDAAARLCGDGSPDGFRVTLTDITEERRAAEALRESEERFRVLIEGMAQAVWETDAAGEVIGDSPSWQAYTGQSREEALGHGWLGAIHPNDRDYAWRQWRKAVSQRFPVDAEFRVRNAAGGWRWANVRAAPLMAQDGSVRKWVGMNVDVNDRKAAEAALEEANRRKDEFLAALGHELRNPLAALVNSLELERALPAGPELDRVRGVMERQAERLSRLVDDLTDVSRTTRGALRLQRQRLDLVTAVREALEADPRTPADLQRRVSLDLADEALPVDADPVRLSQVFGNLLDNAMKFSKENDAVSIRVYRDAGHGVVCVRDRGMGIDPATLPRIFDLFVQDHGSDKVDRGGLGIGLTLVRQLVELHAGSIEARSEGRGKGSEFIVRLPLAGPLPGPAPRDRKRAADLAGQRLLVVDDNPDVADSVRLLAETRHAEVRVAYDGGSALDICNEWHPTGVLLDLGMPGMDGFETARRLRALRPDRPFRLIAMSGWNQDQDHRRARGAGFDLLLAKPFRIEELEKALEAP